MNEGNEFTKSNTLLVNPKEVAAQEASPVFIQTKESFQQPFESDQLQYRPGVEFYIHSAPFCVISPAQKALDDTIEGVFQVCSPINALNGPTGLSFYENSALDDSWEVYSNVLVQDASQPFRLLPTVQTHNNQTSEYFSLITPRLVDANDVVVEKPEENIEFLVIKQKRYKRKQNINYYSRQSTPDTHEFEARKPIKSSEQSARFFKNSYFFQQISQTGAKNPFDFYSVIKLSRARAETFSVNLSRRLLRTTRTLVLPAYTNISIIANSYDVVHSWFIPGLGLKIDCVPGKSTHHSLYIDNVGLYYGQCAEICGRYHHHMPIRICALPFDHFIV